MKSKSVEQLQNRDYKKALSLFILESSAGRNIIAARIQILWVAFTQTLKAKVPIILNEIVYVSNRCKVLREAYFADSLSELIQDSTSKSY